MATGIPFAEANTVLRAPTPEDAAAGTVYDLHVHRYNDLDGNPNVISKWRFTPEELALVVAHDGAFWFHSWGHTHPPVGIEGRNPFIRGGQYADPADLPAAKSEAECAELRRVLATIARDARPDNWDDEPGPHADAWRQLDTALGK